MRAYWELAWTFARIGSLMFGGGYVMLPLLQREVVEKKGWVSQEELLDCFAISQCTPGVIAVNAATYVGYRQKGIVGSVIATVGVIVPSLIMICILAGVLQQLAHYPAVVSAFAGIRVAVAALVTATLWRLYRKGVKGAFANGLFAAALVLSLLGVNPVWIVVGAAALGVASAARRKRA